MPRSLSAVHIGAFLLGCAVALAGCAGYERGLGPVALLDAAVEPGGVRLTNRDDEPIYFSVVAADYVLSGAFGFTPCISPDACSAVAPGTSHIVPVDGILGISAATKEVFVYYRLLHPVAGGEHAAVALDVRIVRRPPTVSSESGSPF